MKHILSVVAIFALSLMASVVYHAIGVSAQEMHPHRHEPAEKLGQVNFATSCNPEAQRQFNRAVAWLHSFEYEEAEKAFTEVTVTDPRCGMAYWGIAMSHYHLIWAPPSAAELQKGATAVEKAKSVSAKTPRERDYIAAIEVFYKDSVKVDHRTRTFAFSEKMKELYEHYGSDHEHSILPDALKFLPRRFFTLTSDSLSNAELPMGKCSAEAKQALSRQPHRSHRAQEHIRNNHCRVVGTR